MLKMLLGIVVAFAIGAACRLSGIPLPSPPQLFGALLVVSMTLGYLLADRWAKPNTQPQEKPQQEAKR